MRRLFTHYLTAGQGTTFLLLSIFTVFYFTVAAHPDDPAKLSEYSVVASCSGVAASGSAGRDGALSGGLLITGAFREVIVTAWLLVRYSAAFALQCYSHVVRCRVQ